MKKKKKVIIVSSIILVLIFSLTITLGRYVYDFARNHYLEAKNFYFTSTTMSSLGTSHNINNWDGVNPYEITIDLSSKKNVYLKMNEDINYNIAVECTGKVRCVTNKTTGIIRSATNADSYTVTVYPTETIQSGDIVKVTTSATSSDPYEKTLSTTYEIGIETYSFSYKINDSVGANFLELELNNAFAYYEVTSPFGTHQIGDKISMEEYALLNENDKKNCKSAIVTITFDPNKIQLDMTDLTYINKATDIQYLKINNHDYVKKFTFKMDANTTKKINFYKPDKNINYTYPGGMPNSIVNVSVDTVN